MRHIFEHQNMFSCIEFTDENEYDGVFPKFDRIGARKWKRILTYI